MPTTRRATTGNLPVELSSFVGRRRELGEVKRLLAESRLVTLTGVGGTGKTRLAVRVGAELWRAFADGVWFVDLIQLSGPGLLANNIHDPDVLAFLVTATLGLRDQGSGPPLGMLVEQLAGRRMLLVLDNCEHLLPACAVLADALLRGCRGLRILTTSREPLGVGGEVLFPVPPLSAPDPGRRPGLAEVGRFEAVALFLARAGAAMPGFVLTEDNHFAVAELCHRLDGLPLAIELASAWVRVLAPEQILARLTDRFALLSRGSRNAPERQHTLRTCVGWSFDLCAKPERVLWARLSVFAGGFELDAVEGICADEHLPEVDLLAVVTGLVDKSILVRDDVQDGHGEAARYRMLETIREFGQEHLVEADEDKALRRRHRDWYQQLADRASAEGISDRKRYWTARLTREHANLRTAVEYGLTEPDQADTALRLVVTVPLSYWTDRGLFREVRRWLDDALAKTSTESALRSRALLFNAQLAISQGDGEVGVRLLDSGEDLARQLDASVELAYAAFVRSLLSLYRGDPPAAVDALERMDAILSTVPKPESGLALALRLNQLTALGLAAELAGDHDRADTCFQQLLAIAEPLGEHRHRVQALWGRALTAWHQGKAQETMTFLVASLQVKQIAGSIDPYSTARCVEMMAWVAARQQQYRRAATLLGAADAMQITVGYLIGDHEACERQTRAGLDDPVFTAAFTRGQALSHNDAITYALDEQHQPTPPPPADWPTPLTRRESQVAQLIAEGLSNKDIASRLVISQRTAESHVEHILTKLGVTNRAQVAAWAAPRPNDQDS